MVSWESGIVNDGELEAKSCLSIEVAVSSGALGKVHVLTIRGNEMQVEARVMNLCMYIVQQGTYLRYR